MHPFAGLEGRAAQAIVWKTGRYPPAQAIERQAVTRAGRLVAVAFLAAAEAGAGTEEHIGSDVVVVVADVVHIDSDVAAVAIDTALVAAGRIVAVDKSSAVSCLGPHAVHTAVCLF